MKILFTSTFYPPFHLGGDALHVKYLADALIKEGHEIHVFTLVDSYRFKKKDYSNKNIKDNKVIVHRIKTKFFRYQCFRNYTFGSSKKILIEFGRLVKEIKPDIVHHHNISLLGWNILKKIGNYKNIYTAHDYWLICPKYDLLREFKECKLDKNCFLFMGALEHHKGILDLIDLFKETNKKLIIAGSGTLENKIKKKLDKNIFFIGWIEGKKKYSVLKNAKALLLPSKWPENMPLVALESLSYGVPVFGSNYGGIPEIIEKFKDKPYFTKNNFFRDLKKIEKIRKKECIEIYKKYFSKEAYLKKYYDAIS